MVTRIISGVVLALIVAPLVLFLPNLYFLIAILIAIGIACHELSQLFIKANEPIIPIFTDIAVSCLACSLYSGDSEIILAAVILIVTIAFIIVISKGEKGDMKAALNSIFVITFLAAPLVSLALIHNEIQGELIVFTLIFANAACDIGGYTVGKLLGSRKLAPSISPHKTVEGFIGGVLFAVVAGVTLGTVIFDFELYLAIAIATIVSIAGPLGDLSVSKIKRSFNVEDTGKIIPGHGGILDRIDSLMFSAACLYVFLIVEDFIIII